MSLTEVAFELGDPRHPLCRLTLAGAHAVYRLLDTGELGRRHRAHLAFHGAPEAAIELVRDLRVGGCEADVLLQTPQTTTLAVSSTTEGARGLAALPAALLAHDVPAAFDPVIAREGRLRVRAVVPRTMDAQLLLRALQDAQRACGFSEFRVQRIAPLAPLAHIEAARRSLAPEQESILALAAAMGYYETPKVVTLEEISRAVGLSISPIHKRLKTAEETIVAQHVGEEPREPPRRRARSAAAPVDAPSPWEMLMRIQGDVGPARVLAQSPGARASLHVLSADEIGGSLSLLVAVASESAQEALLADYAAEGERVSVRVLERSSAHIACRVRAREGSRHSFSWFTRAWGHDASLRSFAFEGGESHVRALLLKPHARERLQERIAEAAKGARWDEWDVLSLRSLGAAAPPSGWPEPLTQRQLEVLRVAHALGYYRTPRSCTLEQVAGTLGVSANAIHKNLVHAESKLIAAYLAAGL